MTDIIERRKPTRDIVGDSWRGSGDRLWIGLASLVATLVLAPVAALALIASEGAGDLWPHLVANVIPVAFRVTGLLLVGVGILVILIGAGTAWLVTAYDFPGRRILDWALLLPLAVPTYIIAYAYLDGRTRDRATPVARFQNDAGCPLFLISLKAGGLGLNLTAAEYVFLLDPWWNPAVEAQAIDRAHRIGQTRHVLAYRLVVKDTVEEKILDLQQTKRALADAIIQADSSLLRDLSREDLELLLS